MIRKWRKAHHFDPYRRLAAAVIHKAAKDYYNLCKLLDSPRLRADLAESYEVECNNIEAFLVDPINPYINYLGIDPDVIEQCIMDPERWLKNIKWLNKN